MNLNIAPQDDHRHILQPGEHEAIHFVFTLADGAVFGYVRTLFGYDDVLEVITLRTDGRTWVHQQRYPRAPLQSPTPDASAPTLSLVCQVPWEQWTLRFDGEVRAADSDEHRSVTLDARYIATTRPVHNRFGPLHQLVQQDGTLEGEVQFGEQTWDGPWTAIRDHTWGRRPMDAVTKVFSVSIPEHLHVIITDSKIQPPTFGHWIDVHGVVHATVAPQVTPTGSGWRIQDLETAMPVWTAERLVTPMIIYYGQAGQEQVRNERRPGDLLKDELGPACFVAPDGTVVTGFFDQLQGGKHND